jgi:hypothetical protein
VYGCSLFGGCGGPEKGRFVLKQTVVYFLLLLAVFRAGDLLILRRLAGDFLPFFTMDLATLLFLGDFDRLFRPFRAAFFGDFDLFRDLDLLFFVVFRGDLDLFLFLGDFDLFLLFIGDFDLFVDLLLLLLLLGDLDRFLTVCFGDLDLFLAGVAFLTDLDLDLDLLFDFVLDRDLDLDLDFALGTADMLTYSTVDQLE